MKWEASSSSSSLATWVLFPPLLFHPLSSLINLLLPLLSLSLSLCFHHCLVYICLIDTSPRTASVALSLHTLFILNTNQRFTETSQAGFQENVFLNWRVRRSDFFSLKHSSCKITTASQILQSCSTHYVWSRSVPQSLHDGWCAVSLIVFWFSKNHMFSVFNTFSTLTTKL